MKNSNLVKMFRFQFLQYRNRVTIRTFNKEVYILKTNLMVQNVETNEVRKIEEIYYDIRTVRNIAGKIIAKRRNKKNELFFITTETRAKVI
ncbi:hypothetical protein [Niallia taxi]|uniref:hypothetical protein n=1 Tax=Niallia taxi TaxID=2499688 RepID=UPI002E1C34E0|nr:hypothetical protein [Niallia taxi]